MSSVKFLTSLGGDDSTVSDDTNPDTGLRNGGYRTRFVAALVQMVALLQFMVSQVQIASAYAASALNAPGTQSTSSTSNLIASSGDKTFTTQTGKLWFINQPLMAGSAGNPGNSMSGYCKSYNPATGALVITMSASLGSGTYADWIIGPTGPSGGVNPTRALNAAGLVTGGGNLGADRTFTVTASTAAQVAAGTDTTTAMTPASLQLSMVPQTLTDAATINWNWALRKRAKVTLGGNRTLAAPTNMIEGDIQVLDIYQDGTGSRLLTFNSCFKFGDAGTPTLSTTAGKRDKLTVTCVDAATPIFDCTFARGF
jgi:hypothetical protein